MVKDTIGLFCSPRGIPPAMYVHVGYIPAHGRWLRQTMSNVALMPAWPGDLANARVRASFTLARSASAMASWTGGQNKGRVRHRNLEA